MQLERYREENDLKVVLGKRKKNDNDVVRETSDSETDDRRARKEKRKQQETERIMEEMKKTRRGQEEREESDKDNTGSAGQEEEEEDFEIIIKRVQEKIGKINSAVSKENGGKINVTRADQQVVKDSSAGLLNDLVGIVLTQIKMERRLKKLELESIKKEETIEKLNKELRNTKREGRLVGEKRGEYGKRRVVSGGHNNSSEESSCETAVSDRRTYAEVSKAGKLATWEKVGKKGKISGRVVVTGKEGWKTPPIAKARSREQAVIISGKKGQNSKLLVEELTKKVGVKDIGGPPKAVRKIRDGRVVVVTKDGEQAEKIKGCLQNMEGVEAVLRKKSSPLLRISGVDKGIADNDIIAQIKIGAGASEKEDIKIIRRITCRNIWKENIILQTGVELFKKIVKRGRVEMDCVLYFAEEYLGLSQCYKCCRFGHIMRACAEKEVCCMCGGGHDIRECKNKERKCPNCWRMFGKKCEHSARDSICPAFQKILEKSRQNLNYRD